MHEINYKVSTLDSEKCAQKYPVLHYLYNKNQKLSGLNIYGGHVEKKEFSYTAGRNMRCFCLFRKPFGSFY